MNTPKDCVPAFPVHISCYDGVDRRRLYGMTLRDYFAGQALTTMTAAPDYSKGPCNAAMAERAYIIADAMLAERGKTGGGSA